MKERDKRFEQMLQEIKDKNDESNKKFNATR